MGTVIKGNFLKEGLPGSAGQRQVEQSERLGDSLAVTLSLMDADSPGQREGQTLGQTH